MRTYKETSRFGQRGSEFHVGIDFAARIGTPVPATSTGEVIYSGPSGGFGYAVTVKSVGPDGEYYVIYGHVDPATALRPGAKVSIGKPIGTIGTPRPGDGELTTGPHVHEQIVTQKRLKELNEIAKAAGKPRNLSINKGTSGGVGLRTGKDWDAFQDPSTFTAGPMRPPSIR